MARPIAKYRELLRAGGERPLIAGLTYGQIAHSLDMPRSLDRPRGILDNMRKRLDNSASTHYVMTAHIVKTSSQSLGAKHKRERKRNLTWKLSARTRYQLVWAKRIHWDVEHLVDSERNAAWLALANDEVLTMAYAQLRRSARIVPVRKRLNIKRTKSQDAERKRNERAALKARIATIDNARMRLSAAAHANGTLTND